MSFFTLIAVASVLLMAPVCIGIVRWQKPGGKLLVIIGGLLLLLLGLFVVCVLALVWSADHGAPM